MSDPFKFTPEELEAMRASSAANEKIFARAHAELEALWQASAPALMGRARVLVAEGADLANLVGLVLTPSTTTSGEAFAEVVSIAALVEVVKRVRRESTLDFAGPPHETILREAREKREGGGLACVLLMMVNDASGSPTETRAVRTLFPISSAGGAA